MRSKPGSEIERGRILVGPYATPSGGDCQGAFLLRPGGVELGIICGAGMGWDHVSVSRKNRVPNWAEMEHVKRLFFKADEVAVQYHVPPAEHINIHPYVLHLWRPQAVEIPRPPRECV